MQGIRTMLSTVKTSIKKLEQKVERGAELVASLLTENWHELLGRKADGSPREQRKKRK